eukprot:g876.t1
MDESVFSDIVGNDFTPIDAYGMETPIDFGGGGGGSRIFGDTPLNFADINPPVQLDERERPAGKEFVVRKEDEDSDEDEYDYEDDDNAEYGYTGMNRVYAQSEVGQVQIDGMSYAGVDCDPYDTIYDQHVAPPGSYVGDAIPGILQEQNNGQASREPGILPRPS